MKKLIAFLLAVVTCVSLAACGASSNGNYHKLGETVSTDIFEFTLDAAEFTVALSNIVDETYFTPKEYNSQTDSDNPYVAPVGHTYAAFTYTVKNLNRASSEFHNGYSFVTVKYDGKKHSAMEEGAFFQYEDEQYMDASGNLEKRQGNKWYKDPGNNLLLLTGEKETRRAYIDIETNVNDLTSDVEITFKIPNSEGKTEEFTYLVTATDREALLK